MSVSGALLRWPYVLPPLTVDGGLAGQVRTRYAEQYDYDAITTLLGMEKSSGKTEEEPAGSRIIPAL